MNDLFLARILKDLFDNKDEYLNLINKKEYKEKGEKLYKILSDNYSKFYLSLLNDINNRQMYLSLLKKHKIDPYIAGGAMHGMLGLGAGVAAAVNTSINNEKIDNNRKYYKEQVSESSLNLKMNKNPLLKSLNELEEFLSSFEEVQKLREKKLDQKYLETICTLKNNILDFKIYKNLINEFNSFGDYKDSFSLANYCMKKYKSSRFFLIFLLSLIFSNFIILVVGNSIPYSALILINLISIVVSYIMFLFYVK